MNRVAFFIGFSVLSLGAAHAAPPLAVTVSGNKINPSNEAIRFDVANPGHEAAETHVFSLQGEDVAQLAADSLSRFSWDGKDVNQQPVASGMYVVQIRHHGQVWHGPVSVNR